MSVGMNLWCDYTFPDGFTCDAVFRVYTWHTYEDLIRRSMSAGWQLSYSSTSHYCPEHVPRD